MTTLSSSVRQRFVALETGVTLPYVETGNSDGIPVVFLHGFTDSWRSYEAMLPHLPAGIRALALTMRGHGEADRPATGYRQEDFAADVAAFLDALGLNRAIIVGHSMGSSVAQRFVIDYPERCLGLVLIAASTMWGSTPVVLELSAAVAELDDPIDPGFVHEFQASTVVRPVPDALIATAVAESLRVPARVWREALANHMAADLSHDLGDVTAPTLLLAGDWDEVAPPEAQLVLRDAIPGARLIAYPDGGHSPHWEDPARVAADIAAFVGALSVGAAPSDSAVSTE